MGALLTYKSSKIKVDYWSSNISYEKGSLIQYNGSIYSSDFKNNLNNNPELKSGWTKIL